MRFEDIEVDSIFSYDGYTYIKIDPIIVSNPSYTTSFNSKDIDTSKADQMHPDATVSLVPIREEFERLWKSSTGPIDKSLCYKFYKMGVER